MPDRNKVKFGISNFTWWKVTETVNASTGATETTYSAAYKEPGLVSIGLDPQGDRTVFRADNSDYYVAAANGGYSGSLVLADLSDDLREYAFDEKRDDNDVVVEDDKSGVTTKYIACAFEFIGDKKNVRHLLPKCSLTKPSITSETTPEGNTPNVQTDSVTLSAVARPDDGVVHMKADPNTDSTVYDAWYTTPYVPEFTP